MLCDQMFFLFVFFCCFFCRFFQFRRGGGMVSAVARADLPHGRHGRGQPRPRARTRPRTLPTPADGRLVPNHLLQPPVHSHAHPLPPGRGAAGARHPSSAPPGCTPPDTVRSRESPGQGILRGHGKDKSKVKLVLPEPTELLKVRSRELHYCLSFCFSYRYL